MISVRATTCQISQNGDHAGPSYKNQGGALEKIGDEIDGGGDCDG